MPALGNELFALTVRIFYRKLGRTKYISHLDLVRCVSRALKRSKLPVWHTLGFNPHIYLTFALPLALGYESECESMDFRLVEELPMGEVVDRLNAVFPEGLEAFAAAPAGQKPEEIAWADYEIAQEFGGRDAAGAKAAFEAFCARESIPVMKKTKKGERELDLKPHFSVLSQQAEGETLRLGLRMAAGNTLNVNPTLLLDAFAAGCGWEADWTRVVRKRILDGKQNDFH